MNEPQEREPDRKSKVVQYAISSTMLVSMFAGQTSALAAGEETSPDAIKNALQELMDKGIITGDESGNTRVDGQLTRLQMAAMLARALELDVSGPPEYTFSDVSGDSWGLKYASVLKKLGIMIGSSDGSFRPNAVMTREEMAAVFVRVTQVSITGKGTNLGIADSDQISDWAKPYVQVAIEQGFLKPQDGRLNPQGQVGRSDIVVFTRNFVNSENFDKYKEVTQSLLNVGGQISNSDPTV